MNRQSAVSGGGRVAAAIERAESEYQAEIDSLTRRLEAMDRRARTAEASLAQATATADRRGLAMGLMVVQLQKLGMSLAAIDQLTLGRLDLRLASATSDETLIVSDAGRVG